VGRPTKFCAKSLICKKAKDKAFLQIKLLEQSGTALGRRVAMLLTSVAILSRVSDVQCAVAVSCRACAYYIMMVLIGCQKYFFPVSSYWL
jgi:hypothetical protein